MKFKTKQLAISAVIAAIYAVMTVFPGLNVLSFGAVQFRVSEVLCVLPLFTPAAIYGLTAGCFLANIISTAGALDIIFGTAATLLASIFTYYMRRLPKAVAMLPPVIFNGIIVGWMITYFYTDTAGHFYKVLCWNMFTVALGEFGVCYILGLPLIKYLNRNKIFLNNVRCD